jgi:hypothetical protein
MISTLVAGVHPDTNTRTPSPASDYAIGPRPELRAEFALRGPLPRGRWYRKLAAVLCDPQGTEPTVFHSAPAALAEWADAIALAEIWLCVEDPHLELWVRQVTVGHTLTTVGPWRVHDVTARMAVTR